MAIDVNAILRDYLVATGTDLYTLVGTRVYAGRQPPPAVWSNTTPAVLFWRRGGLNDKDAPIYRPSWQVECYGGSLDIRDAQAVYGALEERLRDAKIASVSSGILLNCVEETAGQDLIDTDTEWPFVLSFWTAECREAS